MIVFILVLVVALIVLVKSISKILEDDAQEIGVVEPHKAHGFIVVFKQKNEPPTVVHAMSFSLIQHFDYYRTAEFERVLSVVPVVDPEEAMWAFRKVFTQQRYYGFNTMQVTFQLMLFTWYYNDKELAEIANG
jgi:hypothetical protein